MITEKTNLITENELKSDLQQFIGTENYYKVGMYKMLVTDGIKYMAEKVGAFWFLDIIGTEFNTLNKPFQVIYLNVNKDESCVITSREDANEPVLHTRKIEYTDFPVGQYEFYLIDNIMLLKSEY